MWYTSQDIFRLTVVCLFCTIMQNMWAQSDEKVNEFEHWEGVQVNFQIDSRWEVGCSAQTRWSTDPSEINNAFFEVEPEFEAFKNLSFKGGYRYSTDFDDRSHRLFIGAEPEVDLTKDLKIDIRVRFDHNWYGNDSDQELRWRVRPEYDLGKTEIFVFTELFLDDAKVRTKWRYALGYQYKFDGGHMLDIRGMLDEEIDENVWIISMVYSYDF